MDETFQIYINRVAPLTLSDSHKQQLQNIQKSPKFQDGKPVLFPGYSLIAPPSGEDLNNQEFYQYVKSLQEQLSEQLPQSLMIPLPPESFHLTIADLIWNGDFRNAVAENPEYEAMLRKAIATSFENYQTASKKSTIQLQLLGLAIFPRALAVCLLPKDEEGYNQISQLRRAIYQNPEVIALGIQQQYLFTAHVTLGYFGEIPSDLDRDRLCDILSNFNDRLVESQTPLMTIDQAQLRKFDDMTYYYRQPDWPVVEF